MKKKEKIPPARVIAYVILSNLLLIMGSFLWMRSSINQAESAQQELFSLGEKLLTKTKEQETNRQVMNQYRGKDPLFLHKKLESLPLLATEVAKLRVKVEASALPEDVLFDKRLQILTNGENAFSFVESSTEIGKIYKEVVEHQSRPVEVDTTDLYTILNIIEGSQEMSSRPDLIISDALIEKRKSLIQETWNLTLNIVRREYQNA